ncbi:MAG: protein-export chaperone SecB [Gammaproteobacteria bacterium]
MSDSDTDPPRGEPGSDGQEAQRGEGQVRLEKMYLKDSSFESPNSPAIFRQEWKPDIEMQVNTRSERIEGTTFEVVVTVTVTAKLEGRIAFIAEVQQAGLFVMEGLPDPVIHRAAGTFCPTTLFPYVREAVDSLVVRGGFPPLHLVPINFDAAYEEALRHAQGQGQPTH